MTPVEETETFIEAANIYFHASRNTTYTGNAEHFYFLRGSSSSSTEA